MSYMKSGKLKFIGEFKYGLSLTFKFVECVDCETRYRIDLSGQVQCNGRAIKVCPWCRPDFKNVRLWPLLESFRRERQEQTV